MKKFGVMMYVIEGLIDLSKTPIASNPTEMQKLIRYILNCIRFTVLYVSLKVNIKGKIKKKKKLLTLQSSKKEVKPY